VFQLESRGMKRAHHPLRPDCFEDIIALVALFRPGPLQSGMVDNFIDRKHGREEVAYPHAEYQHESLKPVLEPTYGIILYQEQVMQIAQVLAGYTLGGADLLRRAMGKKKPEEMAKQRSVFRGAPRAGRRRGKTGHQDLRPGGEVRRLRLQQVALGGLRPGVLPDRLAEGPLSRPRSWPR
jgi:DNA polymerase-3 subunit alpha